MKERINPYFKPPEYEAVWQSREAIRNVMSKLIPGDIAFARVNAIRGTDNVVNQAIGMVLNASEESVTIWNLPFSLYIMQGVLTFGDLTFPNREVELINAIPTQEFLARVNSGFKYDQKVSAYTLYGEHELRVKGFYDNHILGLDTHEEQLVIVSDKLIT